MAGYLILLLVVTTSSAQIMLRGVYDHKVETPEKEQVVIKKITYEENEKLSKSGQYEEKYWVYTLFGVDEEGNAKATPVNVNVPKTFICPNGRQYTDNSTRELRQEFKLCNFMRTAPPRKKVYEKTEKSFADFIMAVRKCLYEEDLKCLAEHVGHPVMMYRAKQMKNQALINWGRRGLQRLKKICPDGIFYKNAGYYTPQDYVKCIYRDEYLVDLTEMVRTIFSWNIAGYKAGYKHIHDDGVSSGLISKEVRSDSGGGCRFVRSINEKKWYLYFCDDRL